MSFVRKDPQRLKTPQQVASECLSVARARSLDDFAAVLAVMCIAQESDFWCPANKADPSSFNYPHDSESNDGRSVGYFQQQNGRAGDTLPADDRDNWWGPMVSRMTLKLACNEFLDRLEDSYMSGLGNPARATELISNVQRPRVDLRGAYAKHYDRAVQLVNAAKAGVPEPTPGGNDVGFVGDPMWLEEVLRPALGNRLIVHDGWNETGTGGTMGDIWGVMVHHTANQNETPERIIGGRADLRGPLAQILIDMDGDVHLCAVGPCNHGGVGSYPGLGTNTANQRAIGIECAYPTMGPGGSFDPREPWKRAQVLSLRDTCAAIIKRLGYRAEGHLCGHKDYAGKSQGKIDPSNMDVTGWLAREVQKKMDGFKFPGEDDVLPPPPVSPVTPPQNADAIEYYANCAYWEMLGWRTPVEAMALLVDAITGSHNAGKPGMSLTRPVPQPEPPPETEK